MAREIVSVKKTNNFISKTTWGLALLVGLGSIALTLYTKSPIA